jgi:hypothetical protein
MRSDTFASPKSASFGTPVSVSSTLPGLMSRWITWLRCACSSASASTRQVSAAQRQSATLVPSRRAARSTSTFSRLPPVTSSWTMSG